MKYFLENIKHFTSDKVGQALSDRTLHVELVIVNVSQLKQDNPDGSLSADLGLAVVSIDWRPLEGKWPNFFEEKTCSFCNLVYFYESRQASDTLQVLNFTNFFE